MDKLMTLSSTCTLQLIGRHVHTGLQSLTDLTAVQAIFQRLVEDEFYDLAPSIIVTAKGMPDLSTRVFLRHLHEAFPELPVLGLVDWNPSGI